MITLLVVVALFCMVFSLGWVWAHNARDGE
jgi:hypothetical protein